MSAARQRFLAIIAAPLITATAYFIYIAPALQRDLETLRKSAAQRPVAAQTQPRGARAESEFARRRLAELTAETQRLETEIRSLSNAAVGPFALPLRVSHAVDTAAPEAIAELGEVLRRHHLIMLEDGPATVSLSALLPASLNSRLAAQTLSPAGVWRLRLRGDFLDVLDALDDLAHAPAPVFVLGVTLTPATNGQARPEWEWLLWL